VWTVSTSRNHHCRVPSPRQLQTSEALVCYSQKCPNVCSLASLDCVPNCALQLWNGQPDSRTHSGHDTQLPWDLGSGLNGYSFCPSNFRHFPAASPRTRTTKVYH